MNKFNYGNYSSNNYGFHTMAVSDGDITYYYSYDTLIAFVYKGIETVRQNIWGNTTGKHLNWINPDKSIRVDGDTFNKKLKESKNSIYEEIKKEKEEEAHQFRTERLNLRKQLNGFRD